MVTGLDDFDKIIGKTIKAIYRPFSSDLMVVFTDNTVICMESEGNEDCSEISIQSFRLLRYGMETAIELGLCSREEYTQLETKDNLLRETERKERRRKEFELLKKEFETEK